MTEIIRFTKGGLVSLVSDRLMASSTRNIGPWFGWMSPDCAIRPLRYRCIRMSDLNLGESDIRFGDLEIAIWLNFKA